MTRPDRTTSPLLLALILAAICCLASVAALAQPPAVAAPANDVGRSEVEQAIRAGMERYAVPAAGVALIDNYKVIWTEGYGRRVATSDTPVTPTTLFQAASISKPVTALAALRLVEQDKLDLDEDVNRRLSSWQVPDSPLSRDNPVTLRRLLSHSAGLNVHGFRGYAAAEPLPTLLQILDGASPANSESIRLVVKPGYLFRYSGGGYCIAQQLLLDTTHLAFPDLMRREVLDPLEMKHSTYQHPLPEALAAQAAFGHLQKQAVVPGNYHTYPEMAAAGLWTTPADLALVAIDLARSVSSGQGRLLSQSMARGMLKVEKGNYGLGLSVHGEGPALNFGHGGGNEGYRCQFVCYPATGQGLVIMTNSDTGSAMFAEVIKTAARAYAWPKKP